MNMDEANIFGRPDHFYPAENFIWLADGAESLAPRTLTGHFSAADRCTFSSWIFKRAAAHPFIWLMKATLKYMRYVLQTIDLL